MHLLTLTRIPKRGKKVSIAAKNKWIWFEGLGKASSGGES